MSRWNRFWFSPGARGSMGVFRIILCAWLALGFVNFLPDVPFLLKRPFFEPAAGLRWLGIHSMQAMLVEMLVRAAWVFVIAAALGAGTRFSLLGLAFANFILRAFQSSWSYTGHSTILPALAVFILAVAPGSTAWSLDELANWAWDRFLRRPRPLLAALAGPPVPAWPAKLVLASLGIVYFASGYAKVADAGKSWFSGRTLQWYLEGNAHQKRFGDSVQFFSANRAQAGFKDPWGLEKVANSAPRTPAGARVASSRPACAALAWLTILLECGFLAVLFLPTRARFALLAAGAVFHFSIDLLMHIDFSGYALLYLAAVDWGAVTKWRPLRRVRS